MKKFIKDKKIYFINILVVLSIFIISLLINHITPFGNNILGKSDAITQFKPMLFDLITKIKNGTLLNYSFNNGLGSPFIFNYIYYLASPFNLIALLFKSPDSMYLSTLILKLLVGSITMTYYTRTKTKNSFIVFCATISYLFSSWFLTYYYCNMWLDIFVLLPLYQKGLEDLLDKKKTNTYIITLALLSISNIYLAFPVYIYTIIYFLIYELIYKKGTFKEKLLKFDIITLSTIASFFIISLFLYISFDVFLKTGLKFESGDVVQYTIKFKDFIKSLFYGNTNLLLFKEGNTFPNIAMNTFVFINCLYFFINKKISNKNKIFSLISILIILGAIFIKKFDFVLNFFHDVRGLTYRYAFIINFLTIKLFIHNLINTEEKDYKKMLLTIPIILILLLISFKKQEFNILVFNICFILSYLVILLLYQDNKWNRLIICLLIVIQSTIALSLNILEDKPKENIDLSQYQKDNVKYRLNEMENDLEEDFNYNLYYNSKVTHQFSTISYSHAIQLADNFGNQTIHYSQMVTDDKNILTSMLFNVKQDYYLEKIFAVNYLTKMADSGLETTVKENLENTIFAMTGIDDIYDKITLKAKEKDNLYYFETDYDYYLIEKINEDKTKSTYPQKYKSFSIEKKYGKETINIYVLNEKKLKKVYDYLSKNQIQYTYYNDNHIEGTINVDIGQVIYTSIPYDESWIVKVDGKETKPIVLLDTLIGIDVTPGKHTISLEYKNNYLVPTIMSITSIVIFILINLKRRKQPDEKIS